MTDVQFESEKEYQVRMSLIKEMLELGLITEKEYGKIDMLPYSAHYITKMA